MKLRYIIPILAFSVTAVSCDFLSLHRRKYRLPVREPILPHHEGLSDLPAYDRSHYGDDRVAADAE